MDEKTIARFRAKVDQRGPDECWPWLGGTDRDGYGSFHIERKKHRGAHRVAFFLANGYWPEPMGLHSCDNPPCCNPGHIRAGSNSENVRDMVTRKRQAVGDRNGMRSRPDRVLRGADHWTRKLPERLKTTPADVLAARVMRAEGMTQRAIAQRLGLSQQMVSLLLSGKRWGHV